jgi:CHAT domain-containing protein/tetratricopeptide (TPR) repeat protein
MTGVLRGPRAWLVPLAWLASPPLQAAPPAPASLADCDARVRAQPRPADAYRCYVALARATGGFSRSGARLRGIVAREPANFAALLALGQVADDSQRPEAEQLLRMAAAGFAMSADRAGEVLARRSLARRLTQVGRLDEAAEEVRRAGLAAGSAPHLEASVRSSEAALTYARGDYGRAFTVFKELEAVVFPDGPQEVQFEVLWGLGEALRDMGRQREAIEYFARRVDLVRERGDLYEEAEALHDLATTMARVQHGGSGLKQLLADALDRALRSGNRRQEGSIRLSLSHDPRAPRAARMAEVRRALATFRDIQDGATASAALRRLALFQLEEDPAHPQKALLVADDAVATARRSGDPVAYADALVTRARMLREAFPRERAIADSLRALDAIERIRNLQPDHLVRARVASEWAPAYHGFAGFLLGSGAQSATLADVDLAFRVLERLRARALLESLDAAGATSRAASRDPRREERDAVLLRIARVQAGLLDPGVRGRARDVALAELDRLELEEGALRDAIARADAAFRHVRQPELPTLRDVQAALAPDQALLVFHLASRRLGGSGSHVFAVTRDGASVAALPDGPQLEKVVALLGPVLDRRDGSETEGVARLHRDLMAPALAALPDHVRRLVIIPDGGLHGLPFEALRPSADGAPIALRYDVTLAPSATLWLRWRKRPVEPRPAVLALADPTLPGAGGAAAFRQAPPWVNGLALGPLPHGRAEARYAVRSAGAGSRLLIGPEASESFVKRADLRGFGILHIAAHAVVDDDHPERSAVVLAPGSADEDGLLQVREVVELDLTDRIVVLTACRSSSGTVLPGEGVMSLARAFFQAGARAVVGSLWTLRDDEAEPFVTAFYRHLSQGESLSQAMASARRERIGKGSPAAGWASLVLLGDGDVVPMPRAPSSPRRDVWATSAAAAVGLLALAFVVIRRLYPAAR